MRPWIVFLIFLCAPPRLFSQSQGPSSVPAEPKGAASLTALAQEAMDRNPEIQAAKRAVEAKRARVPQAGASPNPKPTVGYGGNAVPASTVTAGDAGSARIASRDVDAETLAYEAVWRRIEAKVKQAYFDLWFTDQSLSTLRRDRVLLEKIEKIAEFRYSDANGVQHDVLKAQVELTRLIERQTVLEQARQTFQAQLNSLRNLPAETPIGTPEELKISNVAASLDELQAAAQANYPVLKQEQARVEENRLLVDLAKKEVRTSPPIFRHRKQPVAIPGTAANLESSRQTEASELTTLRYRVKQEVLEVQSSEELLKLYLQGIIPQASLAMESAISSYATGAVDFLNVLSDFTTLLNYELLVKQQIANHQKALARLEELTALNLIQ
jgi:outer membrane protein TolC